MSLIGNLAAKAGLRERRAGVRVPTRGLEALYLSGGEQKSTGIKDIGPAGICLAADDALHLGSKIELTLRRKTIEEAEFGTRVSIPARVVRVGKSEVGLKFITEHINSAEWSKLVMRAAHLSARNDGVRVFRIARALAFLQRISPSAEAHLLDAMSGGMSYDGEERALEIFLLAEDLLLSRVQTPQRHVDPRLVQLIVDKGVNLDDFEMDIAHFWAGLLAASTLEGTNDEESANFAQLLSNVGIVPMRILAAACEKAMRLGWDTGFVFRTRVEYSADGVKKIVGARNDRAIDGGIHSLRKLGLLQNAKEAADFEPEEEIDLTPTGSGLRFYARCNGRLEVPDARAAGGSTS